MTEVYKRLGAISPTDRSEYLLYVAPEATQSLISNITVTNRSNTGATFDINVYRPPYTEYVPTGSTVRIQVGQDNLTQIRDTYDFAVQGNGLGFYYSGTVPQSHIDAILGVQSGNNITVFDGTSTYTFTATGPGIYSGMGSTYVIPGGTGVGGYMSDNGDYADIAGQTATTYGVTQQSDIKDVTPRFITASGQAVMTSTDGGASWTSKTVVPTGGWISGIAYGNGTFAAVSSYSTPAFSVYSIDGGRNWTQTTMPSNSNWKKTAYGNGKFVTVGYNSKFAAYSTNGVSWTQSTIPNSSNWLGVFYGNGKFIALSYPSIFSYSTDAISWTVSTMPLSANWHSLVFAQDKFVAVGSWNASRMAYSTNGITWTMSTVVSPNNNYNYSGVAYGNNTFVAVARFSNIAAISTNGITWTTTTIPLNNGWRDITYANGRFVAVSYFSGQFNSIYSTNGISWTISTVQMPFSNQIAYGEKEFSQKENMLYRKSQISANETKVLESGIVLQSSASIVVKDNSGGNLTISTYGVELS